MGIRSSIAHEELLGEEVKVNEDVKERETTEC